MATTKKKTSATRKSINLALQGGGAHGAFAWGAIDTLLADGRIDIEAISATSAGAMNAVVLADALTDGDRDHARERLTAFWKAIADAGAKYNPVKPLRDWTGRALPIEQSPFYWMFDTMLRVFSPYQLNPMNFNPLRDVLNQHALPARIRVEPASRQQVVGRRIAVAATGRAGNVRCQPSQRYRAVAAVGKVVDEAGGSAIREAKHRVADGRAGNSGGRGEVAAVTGGDVEIDRIAAFARESLQRVPALSAGRGHIKRVPAGEHHALPRAGEVRIQFDLESLSGGGRVVPGAGDSVLIGIERGGSRRSLRREHRHVRP